MKKKTKNIELKDMTVADLNSALDENRAELSRLKFRHVMGQLEKNAELRKARRTVARIMTFIGQKETARSAKEKAGTRCKDK